MNTLEYEAHILEYKAHTLLMFLLAHDEADAKLLGLDLSPVLNAANRDVRGTLSVEDQKVTLTLTNGLTFQSRDRYDYYTRMQYFVQLCDGLLTFHILNGSPDSPGTKRARGLLSL